MLSPCSCPVPTHGFCSTSVCRWHTPVISDRWLLPGLPWSSVIFPLSSSSISWVVFLVTLSVQRGRTELKTSMASIHCRGSGHRYSTPVKSVALHTPTYSSRTWPLRPYLMGQRWELLIGKLNPHLWSPSHSMWIPKALSILISYPAQIPPFLLALVMCLPTLP
jgi:hypothetical protein